MKRPLFLRIACMTAMLLIVTSACQLFSPVTSPTATAPVDGSPAPGSTSPARTLPAVTPPVLPSPEAGKYSAAECSTEGLNPSQSGLGDPYFPTMGNGGYDVQRYTLTLNVDMTKKTIDAREVIQARAQQDLTAFNLEFSGFSVAEVKVNGQAAQYGLKGIEFTITPASPLPGGQDFTVEIAYSGSPKAIQPVNENITLGWIWYDGGSYVASEPVGSYTWFAVNDHPCDKAAYTYVVTVPKPYVVAANGILKDRTEAGGNTRFTWETQQPLASYLATVNIARFREEKQAGPDNLPIRNFYDEGLPTNVEKGFARTPEIVAFYNQLFGPYPFEAYGVAVVNADVGFALETQTLTMVGARMIGTQLNTEMVAAHELAHQWFGDSVSLQSWKNIWLNESFASYAQWMWLEHSLGRQAMDSYAKQWYDRFKDDPTKPGDPGPDDLFSAAVYYRGALALHALRLELGEETFYKILRVYYDRYRLGHTTTDEFIALVNEVSGKDMNSFFHAWLYQEKIPDIPQMKWTNP